MKKEYSLIINKDKSLLNRNLVISTYDRGVDVVFHLLDCDQMTLSSENLYSQIYLKTPLNKQIESTVSPVVNDTVVFTLENEILDRLETEGKYELFIVLRDDKNNVNVLPSIPVTVVQNKFLLKDLNDASINKAGINFSRISSAGNVIKTYNIDGSYNATNWNKGDMITEAKMNKLEKCASNLTDDVNTMQKKMDEILKSKFEILHGKETNPIIISNLSKGVYMIDGWKKDFKTSQSKLLPETSFYFVTYMDTKKANIMKCEGGEKEFLRYRYDKVLSSIYSAEDLSEEVERDSNGNIGLKPIKNQVVNLSEQSNIILPDADNFFHTNLFINVIEDTTLTFPKVIWNGCPIIKKGTMNKINLDYINGVWYAEVTTYNDNISVTSYMDDTGVDD